MAVSHDKRTDAGSNKRVQDRLLDAAEELFCEHGFDGASVRDIAAAAHCNIASVNYYFGGKDKLYAEVWRRHLLLMRDIRLTSIEKVMSQNQGKPRLEDLLQAFANAFVEPLVDESRGRRFIKLMAREMIDRCLPEEIFFKELIRPTVDALQGALVKICPDLEQSKIPLVILSVVGQLMHALHAKAFFEPTDEDTLGLSELDLVEMVDHIVAFSAAGIRAYAEGRT